MTKSVIFRFLQITKVILEYFVFYRFNKHEEKFLGRRMKEACESLGPTFIKMGQLLGTRYEIFSKETCGELQKLLDDAPSFSYELVREIIKHDLGKYPEEIFSRFDKKPVASASIAQVHVAYLNQKKLAVKIRRPFIGRNMETDIRIIRKLVLFFHIFSARIRRFGALHALDELHDVLLKEIDLRNELANISRLRKYFKITSKYTNFKDLGKIIVPKPYHGLCSYNVLTMEFLDGVPMKNFKDVENTSDYDALLSVKTLMNISFVQGFQGIGHVFHGDPHPANLIILKNGDVGLLDYGIVGTYPPDLCRITSELFVAIYTKDLQGLIETFENMTKTKVNDKIVEDLELYLKKTQTGSFGFWLIEFIKILLKNNVEFPSELTLYGRTSAIYDSLTYMIAPNKTALDILGPGFKKGLRKKFVQNIKDTDFISVIYKLTKKLKESPEKLNRIIDKYYDNPFLVVKDMKKELL